MFSDTLTKKENLCLYSDKFIGMSSEEIEKAYYAWKKVYMHSKGNSHAMKYNKNGGYQNKKEVICIETEKKYISISDAARQNNINVKGIHACCSERLNTYKGKHWVYAETMLETI